MKKLFLLLFSIFISFNSYGTWTEVYDITDDANTTYYIDFDTIKARGEYVYFWRLNDYLTPNQGALSSEIYSTGSCKYNKVGILSVIDYKKPMGKGAGESWNPELVWHHPTPKDRFLNAVCKNIDDKFKSLLKKIGKSPKR